MRLGRAKNVAGASESTMTPTTGFTGADCTAAGVAAGKSGAGTSTLFSRSVRMLVA